MAFTKFKGISSLWRDWDTNFELKNIFSDENNNVRKGEDILSIL